MNCTQMSYGTYDFATEAGPIPFLTIDKQFKRSPDGSKIGSTYSMQIDGVLTPLPSGEVGYDNLDAMQDALIEAFSTDGQQFLVIYDDFNVLIEAYPRVQSINLSPTSDNWVLTTDYTINLEWDGEAVSGDIFVDEISETWTIEVDNENVLYNWTHGGSGDRNSTLLNITHDLNAKGVEIHNEFGLVKPAWRQAREWVINQLNSTPSENDFSSNNVINLDPTKFSMFNHIRVERRDEYGGTFNVNESWVAIDKQTNPTDICGNAKEDFTASVREDIEQGITFIDIQGTIEGFESRNMNTVNGFNISTDKWTNASGYFDCIKPKLLNRAKKVKAGITNQEVNPQPVSFSVAHNPTKGIISYNYSYDTRPCNFIDGALRENITVIDIHPNDIFAEIQVLGRARGPILQSMGTVSSSKRAINVDVVVPVPTGCSDINEALLASPKEAVDELICSFQQDISGENVSMFLSSSQESFDIKSGRFTKSVEYTWTTCGGSYISTDLCD